MEVHILKFAIYIVIAHCCFVNYGLVNSTVAIDGNRWPLFVIGHMANTEGDISSYLSLGANAIETDVTFESDGRPDYNYHGFPCDCLRFCYWSQKFPEYLQSLRKIINSSKGNNRLAMVYFDLKVENFVGVTLSQAGKFLANDIITNLLQGSKEEQLPILIFGVPDTHHLALLESFERSLVAKGYGSLLRRVGYDVYLSRKLSEDVLAEMGSKNITKHVWYGQGYSNCFLPSYTNIEHLITLRDTCEEPCTVSPDGIYHWTIDGPQNQRNTLRVGVDGIVTNHPETVIEILQEQEFADVYKVAGLNDVPWSD